MKKQKGETKLVKPVSEEDKSEGGEEEVKESSEKVEESGEGVDEESGEEGGKEEPKQGEPTDPVTPSEKNGNGGEKTKTLPKKKVTKLLFLEDAKKLIEGMIKEGRTQLTYNEWIGIHNENKKEVEGGESNGGGTTLGKAAGQQKKTEQKGTTKKTATKTSSTCRR